MIIVIIMILLSWVKRKNSIHKEAFLKILPKMDNFKKIKISMVHHACTLMDCINTLMHISKNTTANKQANGKVHAYLFF